MTEQGNEAPDLEALKNAVRQAVESGSNIQSQVRELTLSALSSGRPKLQQVREITRAVIEGVSEASAAGGGHTADTIRQSLHGVEDAFSHAGEATVLAFREAAGKAGDFASHDLKQAIEELSSLQHVYADSLAEVIKDVAHAGADTMAAIVNDMHRHARDSGSSFGSRMSDSANELRKLLPDEAHQLSRKIHETTDTIGSFAAGILQGVRETFSEHTAARGDKSEAAKDMEGADAEHNRGPQQ